MDEIFISVYSYLKKNQKQSQLLKKHPDDFIWLKLKKLEMNYNQDK